MITCNADSSVHYYQATKGSSKSERWPTRRRHQAPAPRHTNRRPRARRRLRQYRGASSGTLSYQSPPQHAGDSVLPINPIWLHDAGKRSRTASLNLGGQARPAVRAAGLVRSQGRSKGLSRGEKRIPVRYLLRGVSSLALYPIPNEYLHELDNIVDSIGGRRRTRRAQITTAWTVDP
jgi:hypothetical protein